MRLAALVLVPLASLALLGCPVMHQSPGARAQEAANELNLNTRFGRMEMAGEKVAPKARETFFERRRGWGSKVRIADYELAGMKMSGEREAEMFVRVAWYLVDEGDLRTTTLKQKWHDFKGDWKLVEETRTDGDVGLLGEQIVRVPAPPGARNAQFPTIRLGAEPPAPETIDAPPGPTTNVSVGAAPTGR